VTANKRTHKMEKLARIYDDEILPIWSQRFGRMLLRDLEVPEGGQVLDVACATGYPATEILRRMDGRSRLIAIDGSSAMLDVARRKVKEMTAEGLQAKVFFRTESAAPRLSFADGVYDLVVCNLGLIDMPDAGAAIADFARVTKPGGQVRCTLPLDGTFEEFFDIYREVLIKHDKHDALDRLAEHTSLYPSPGTCEYWMRTAGLTDIRVEVEEFSMLFKSSREFFFAPVIECGPLAEWKAAAGTGQEMQDVFWYIKEAIDAYFTGRAFEVTVKAGCLIGTAPEEVDVAAIAAGRDEEDADELAATGPVDLATEVEAAVYEDDDMIELSTDDIDVEELEAAEVITLDGANRVYQVDDEDVVIEAFVEGSQRPPHLDED
jgi:ubiquinone/menaquinone biosynthesis C-methylase UbiE